MWLAIGQNHYAKNHYDAEACILSWLELANMPTSGKVNLVEYDCEYEDVEVSQVDGAVFTPKGTDKLQHKVIDLQDHTALIEKLGTARSTVDELQYDLGEQLVDGLNT